MGPQALNSTSRLGSLLFSSLQVIGHHTTRLVMESTGEEDLHESHGCWMSCVCLCVNNEIQRGSLYLLGPFLYPVLEKTFYSFLVQKNSGPLCSSAVFNYATPPTLRVFLGTHLPDEGFIGRPSALSQPLWSPCLHTPNLVPRELADSESETAPS